MRSRTHMPVILLIVISPRFIQRSAWLVLLAGLVLAACHREEQAVVGVARTAVDAEHKAKAAAQAAAAQSDRRRQALSAVPLPTKSLYVDVHDPAAWANPFLTVQPGNINLRVTLADANPSSVGQGSMLRPEGARRQELQLNPADLPDAIVALPTGAWRYGRVVAIAEAPGAPPKDRPQMRRNLEAAIQQLNDMGVVVEEWPGR